MKKIEKMNYFIEMKLKFTKNVSKQNEIFNSKIKISVIFQK